MTTTGRPKKTETLVSEHILEIQAIADQGVALANLEITDPILRIAVRKKFHRIFQVGFEAQAHNRGRL